VLSEALPHTNALTSEHTIVILYMYQLSYSLCMYIVLIKMDRYKKLTTQLYQCTCSFFFSYRPIAVENRLKNVEGKTLKR
jgi:hypothetical protein